jgi:hypothetical protein
MPLEEPVTIATWPVMDTPESERAGVEVTMEAGSGAKRRDPPVLVQPIDAGKERPDGPPWVALDEIMRHLSGIGPAFVGK